MNTEEWLLTVLGEAGPAGLSPVQLQKTLFLLGKRLLPDDLGPGFFEFSAYDYGPFCPAIYSEAEQLENQGLAMITPVPWGARRNYSATARGRERATAIKARMTPTARDYLPRIVRWVQEQPFAALIKSVYAEFPDMRANSVFRDIG